MEKVINYNNETTEYRYNQDGFLAKVINGEGEETTITCKQEEEDYGKVNVITELYGDTKAYNYDYINKKGEITRHLHG